MLFLWCSCWIDYLLGNRSNWSMCHLLQVYCLCLRRCLLLINLYYFTLLWLLRLFNRFILFYGFGCWCILNQTIDWLHRKGSYSFCRDCYRLTSRFPATSLCLSFCSLLFLCSNCLSLCFEGLFLSESFSFFLSLKLGL